MSSQSLFRTCVICGNLFTNNGRLSKAKFLLRRFCSRKCANNGSNSHRIKAFTNPEYKKAASDRRKKFLEENPISDEIRKNMSEAQKKNTKNHFKKGSLNHKYGKGDQQRGEKNANWKGGITNPNQKKRNSPEYREWRVACLQRDSYRCTDCGERGWLQVHHIKPVSQFPELAWEIDNGKTVCVDCHEKIHGRFIGKFKQKK